MARCPCRSDDAQCAKHGKDTVQTFCGAAAFTPRAAAATSIVRCESAQGE